LLGKPLTIDLILLLVYISWAVIVLGGSVLSWSMKYLKKVKAERRDPLINKLRMTKVTKEEALDRHMKCITIHEAHVEVARSRRLNPNHTDPKSMKIVCNFPMDGWCAKEYPTDQELAAINARLGGKVSEEFEHLKGKPLAEYIKGNISLNEMNDALAMDGDEEGSEMSIEEIAEVQRRVLAEKTRKKPPTMSLSGMGNDIPTPAAPIQEKPKPKPIMKLGLS
jgi:hypothetical protein